MNKDMLQLLPALIPLLGLLLLAIMFRKEMREVLPEEQQEREEHRSYILTMAGFSFTGLLGLIVADATLRLSYHLAIEYLFLSFLSYLVALNLQSYKSKRWQDYLATSLMDTASLCLILSIISILRSQTYSHILNIIFPLLALIVWLLDWSFRYKINWVYLKSIKETKEMNGDKKPKKTEYYEVEKILNYLYCKKHNIQYPKGSSCPKCLEDASKQKK